MRIAELDNILSAMLRTYDGISDLNFSVGHPLQVEDFGELKPVYVEPPIEALSRSCAARSMDSTSLTNDSASSAVRTPSATSCA